MAYTVCRTMKLQGGPKSDEEIAALEAEEGKKFGKCKVLQIFLGSDLVDSYGLSAREWTQIISRNYPGGDGCYLCFWKGTKIFLKAVGSKVCALSRKDMEKAGLKEAAEAMEQEYEKSRTE